MLCSALLSCNLLAQGTYLEGITDLSCQMNICTGGNGSAVHSSICIPSLAHDLHMCGYKTQVGPALSALLSTTAAATVRCKSVIAIGMGGSINMHLLPYGILGDTLQPVLVAQHGA